VLGRYLTYTAKTAAAGTCSVHSLIYFTPKSCMGLWPGLLPTTPRDVYGSMWPDWTRPADHKQNTDPNRPDPTNSWWRQKLNCRKTVLNLYLKNVNSC